jgi:hypothetical protein
VVDFFFRGDEAIARIGGRERGLYRVDGGQGGLPGSASPTAFLRCRELFKSVFTLGAIDPSFNLGSIP